MFARRSRTPRRTPRHTTAPSTVLAITIAAVALAGCGDRDQPAAAGPDRANGATTFPVTVTDATGEQVEVGSSPQRIVALFDANVGILDELDVDDRIVAIDDFAARPDHADRDLPRIGGDGFTFDTDRIVALRPDLVITSTGTEQVLDDQLRAAGLTVLSLGYPDSLDATWDHVRTLGRVTGTAARADRLADSLERRVDAVAATVHDEPDVATYLETDASSPGKPYTVGDGSLLDELLTLAGARNVFHDDGSAPQVSWESIVAARPDAILLADAVGHVGPNFFGAIEPASVAARPGFDTIPAVRDDRVEAIDADELLVPGPDLPEGLAQLVAAIHPGAAAAARAAARA